MVDQEAKDLYIRAVDFVRYDTPAEDHRWIMIAPFSSMLTLFRWEEVFEGVDANNDAELDDICREIAHGLFSTNPSFKAARVVSQRGINAGSRYHFRLRDAL